MTATLAAWLGRQLQADEALATAATAGPWRHNPSKEWHTDEFMLARARAGKLTYGGEEFVAAGLVDDPSCVATTGPADDAQSIADAAHVAANDPAQTLRRVAAIRQVLALHHSEIEDDPEPYCAGCADEDWPCPTLRTLASMFADRDGYRAEEWRP